MITPAQSYGKLAKRLCDALTDFQIEQSRLGSNSSVHHQMTDFYRYLGARKGMRGFGCSCFIA